MKPTKNRVYCTGCHRTKMLFESQKKADNFIKFNAGEILEETGKAPVRSYYCPFCCGWHVTSNISEEAGEKLDRRDSRIINRMNEEKIEEQDVKMIKSAIQAKLHDFGVDVKMCDLEQAEKDLRVAEKKYSPIMQSGLHSAAITRLHQQLDAARGLLEKYVEFDSLDYEGQQSMLREHLHDADIKKLMTFARDLRNVKAIQAFIANKDLIINASDSDQANDLIELCKSKIQAISGGIGSKEAKSRFNAIVNSIVYN